MSDGNPAEPSKDSLGLDLDSLRIGDDQESSATEQPDQPDASTAEAPATTIPETQTGAQQDEDPAVVEPALDDQKAPPRERKKPYINPERVKTGGPQREKLSEEDLARRMARIREQNEKIKQRRADVEADEQEFKKTQEVERMKQARNKKVQDGVDRAREQNARRKLDKIQNREWDTGKPGVKRTAPPEPSNVANRSPSQTASAGIRGAVRGGAGSRGRGRGRGGDAPRTPPAPQPPVTSSSGEKPAEEEPAPVPFE